MRDIDTTIYFYRRLGFDQVFATVNDGDRVAFMRQNGLVLELYESRNAAGKPGAIDHLSLDVTDIEAAFIAAKEMGCKLLDEEIQFLPFWTAGVRFFTIEGANAEKIEFCQML